MGAELEGLVLTLDKGVRVRVRAWLRKLYETTSNRVWKRNRNAYARLLLDQLRSGILMEPFSTMPGDGAGLPTLPAHLKCATMSPMRPRSPTTPRRERGGGAGDEGADFSFSPLARRFAQAGREADAAAAPQSVAAAVQQSLRRPAPSRSRPETSAPRPPASPPRAASPQQRRAASPMRSPVRGIGGGGALREEPAEPQPQAAVFFRSNQALRSPPRGILKGGAGSRPPSRPRSNGRGGSTAGGSAAGGPEDVDGRLAEAERALRLQQEKLELMKARRV
jgi:hypothetical protein